VPSLYKKRKQMSNPLARISHEEFIWIFILQMNESKS
jgi:hypothetical protein